MNLGDGSFASVAESAGLAHTALGRAAGWADYDNDGDLDLYLANSYDNKSMGDNILYRNDGQAVFVDVTIGSGAEDSMSGTAVAWADYDNDGDLDLFLSNFGGTMRLFENRQAAGGHWLGVSFRSTGPNTHGVGARVKVFAGDHSWFRENSPTQGYQSQAPHQLHFGLGPIAEVDSVVIHWPDGETKRLGPVRADQVLRVERR